MTSHLEQANKNISEILNLKKELDCFNPLKEWDEHFKEKIKKELTYHSNKIEGNKLSYGETIALIESNIFPKDKSIKDILEIKNHYSILTIIFENINFPINETSIKNLHKELMNDSRQWDYESFFWPGKYKFRENYTLRPNGEYFKFADPKDVPKLMSNLIDKVQTVSSLNEKLIIENHPLYRSALFHGKFTEIHPFEDGNGRVARLISNIILMKEGYPPFVVKEQQREKYLNSLYMSTDQNDILPLFNFFSDCLQFSMIQKIEYFKIEVKKLNDSIEKKMEEDKNIDHSKDISM